jgi:transposase
VAGEVFSSPDDIEDVIRKHALGAVRVALETGPLCVWHWHALRQASVPVVCIHARHAKAALMMQLNKTDQNDAYGLAQIVRCGWYREVEVKSMESHRVRLLLTARSRFVSMRVTVYNQIRGLMKTFGVVLPSGKGGKFLHAVEGSMPDDAIVQTVVTALLSTWKTVTAELNKIDGEIKKLVRNSALHRNLMTVPGVGVITAAAYVATIDCPERFSSAKDIVPYLGLTPRRYQSGEIDRNGRVSKCGDAMLRSLLFEAAHALLTRTRHKSALRTWGLALAKRTGPAKVAVARKLAVIMHRMWLDGAAFRRNAEASLAASAFSASRRCAVSSSCLRSRLSCTWRESCRRNMAMAVNSKDTGKPILSAAIAYVSASHARLATLRPIRSILTTESFEIRHADGFSGRKAPEETNEPWFPPPSTDSFCTYYGPAFTYRHF